MAGKIFGKVLDLMGLEESTLAEEEYDYDEYDDGYEEYDGYEDSSQDYRGYDAYETDDRSQKKAKGKVRSIYRGRREQPEPAREYQEDRGEGSSAGRMRMVVYQPMTYDDTQSIVDNLKNRKPIVVNLENLEIDVAQRVLDFMSGAVYALNGNIHKVTKGIFILAPTNVDISGNMSDDIASGSSFYSLGSSRREY